MSTNLWLPFQIQLDSTGSGELEVGSPSLGYNWQAFCTLGLAPAGQTQLVLVSGQVVASGGRQSGAFAAGSGQGVTVSVTGGPPSSSVPGVLQGSVNQGVAAQATLPGGGTLFEISGGTVTVEVASGATLPISGAVTISSGTVDITSGSITVAGGQGGNVNVSTDAPPITGPTLQIAANTSSATITLHPPANATAIGFALVPIGTYTLQVTIQDALTLVELATVSFPAAGPGVVGRSITLPLTPGMTESGITVTAQAGGTLVVATNFAYTLWYLGTNSFQPVNLPTEPLFIQGQGAQGTAAASTYPAQGLDAQVMGLGAASLNSGSQNAVPVDMLVQGLNAAGLVGVGLHATTVDQVVRGQQGSTLVSVQTRPEAPQYTLTLGQDFASNEVITLAAGTAGQSWRLRRLRFTPSVAAELDVQSSATAGSGVVGKFFSPADVPVDFDFEGYALPPGDSIYLAIYINGSTSFVLTLTADQY